MYVIILYVRNNTYVPRKVDLWCNSKALVFHLTSIHYFLSWCKAGTKLLQASQYNDTVKGPTIVDRFRYKQCIWIGLSPYARKPLSEEKVLDISRGFSCSLIKCLFVEPAAISMPLTFSLLVSNFISPYVKFTFASHRIEKIATVLFRFSTSDINR